MTIDLESRRQARARRRFDAAIRSVDGLALMGMVARGEIDPDVAAGILGGDSQWGTPEERARVKRFFQRLANSL